MIASKTKTKPKTKTKIKIKHSRRRIKERQQAFSQAFIAAAARDASLNPFIPHTHTDTHTRKRGGGGREGGNFWLVDTGHPAWMDGHPPPPASISTSIFSSSSPSRSANPTDLFVGEFYICVCAAFVCSGKGGNVGLGWVGLGLGWVSGDKGLLHAMNDDACPCD